MLVTDYIIAQKQKMPDILYKNIINKHKNVSRETFLYKSYKYI